MSQGDSINNPVNSEIVTSAAEILAIVAALRERHQNDLSFKDINLVEVLRNHLIALLSRDFRRKNFSERFIFEEKLLSENRKQEKMVQWSGVDLRNRLLSWFVYHKLRGRNQKTVYVQKSSRLNRVITALTDVRKDLTLISAHKNFSDKVLWVPTYPSNRHRQKRLAAAFLVILRRSLESFGKRLSEHDEYLLNQEIEKSIRAISLTEKLFDHCRMDLVLVAGDNFFPSNILVLMARKYRIPTICLQHGLDCEQFLLDQTYSDYFLVWGPRRGQCCREHSAWQPQKIVVTGNPGFDDISTSCAAKSEGREYWLWLTRPHVPDKCYEPHRLPDEGVRILAVLAEALQQHPRAQLVIKSHPEDYLQPYQELINRVNLADRIRFAGRDERLYPLIQEAGLIFTEDSTTGLEAMFFGKKLIHVNSAPAVPVLPMVAYGAALPGFSREQVLDSIALFCGNGVDEDLMRRNQGKFVDDFAGPLDGLATQRVVAAIGSILDAN